MNCLQLGIYMKIPADERVSILFSPPASFSSSQQLWAHKASKTIQDSDVKP